MKKSMFRDLPAVRNKNRPGSPLSSGEVTKGIGRARLPVTYTWVGRWPNAIFRRAW